MGSSNKIMQAFVSEGIALNTDASLGEIQKHTESLSLAILMQE